MHEIDSKQSKRLTIFIGLCVFAFTCLPLFTHVLIAGHDMSYHLNRIEGIAAALRNGQFPVRLHPNILYDYGYANSIFYPELFLYLPGALRALGVNLNICYKILIAALNAATVLVSYFSFKKLFRSQYAAYIGTILYGLSIYRLLCIYIRAAVGEALAMVFLPLLVLGIYEVFFGNPKKWYYLAFAFTGILQSHIITTELVLYFSIIIGLVCIRRLFRQKRRRLLSVLKAAGFAVLLNLWFLVPFLDFVRYGVKITGTDFNYAGNTINPPSKLFALFYPVNTTMTDRDTMPRSVGLSLFLLVLLFIVFWLRKKREDITIHERRFYFLGKSGLLYGGVALYMSTCLFPWVLFKYIPPLNRIASSLQFPWRLLSVGTVAICITGIVVCFLLKKETGLSGKTVLIAVTVATVFTSIILIDNVIYNVPLYGDLSLSAPVNSTTWVYEGQYSLKGTDVEKIVKRGKVTTSPNPTFVCSEASRRGGVFAMDFAFTSPTYNDFIELPISWYPHYRATIDGAPVETKLGENNIIRIETDGRKQGALRVEWKAPVLYRIAECITAVSLLAFLCYRYTDWFQRFQSRKKGKLPAKNNMSD